MTLIKAFAQGARLITLPAVGVPVLMATVWAFYHRGVFDKNLFIFTLLSGGFIQCAVNFFNDVLDFKKGVDQEGRKGPPRLTAQERFSQKQVMSFGFISLFLACIIALPLIISGGWPILALGLVSCLLTYLYSGSSFAMADKGASELFVILFFGLGAVGGTYYIQTLEWDSSLIYLGLQCGFWALSILLVNYLRDEKEDRSAGRKNLVTLYGREWGLLGLAVTQLLIYLFCFYWLDTHPKAGALSFCTLPLSAVLIYFIAVTPPSPLYNRYLFFMSLLYSLFGIAWIAGFVL
ncbi:MAG: prenyltransferase [Bdellovibrionales bacterium]|nr:prenyltransferase [Bdellovibrionales bacterium]